MLCCFSDPVSLVPGFMPQAWTTVSCPFMLMSGLVFGWTSCLSIQVFVLEPCPASNQSHLCHPAQRKENSCLLHFYIIKICSPQGSNLPPTIYAYSYACNLKISRYNMQNVRRRVFSSFFFILIIFSLFFS